MAAVTVVIVPFFATIIIATRQVVGVSSPDDVILMPRRRAVGTAFRYILDRAE